MNYGKYFKIVTFNQQSLNTVRTAIAGADLDFIPATLYNNKENEGAGTKRNSQVTWLKDQKPSEMLMKMVQVINESAGWNFNITGVEPVQFGVYPKGGLYDWHVDQHPRPIRGVVRKISMTLFMSEPEEYEGGEFDLEIYKPGTNPRYETFKGRKGSAIFFPSGKWHRVRPVTSDDVRKSIVAWFYGPPYT